MELDLVPRCQVQCRFQLDDIGFNSIPIYYDTLRHTIIYIDTTIFVFTATICVTLMYE